jgi:3-phosphoglycerate kinase
VLVRVDYNCPTDDFTQSITDTARIDTTVPSIQAIFAVCALSHWAAPQVLGEFCLFRELLLK